MPLGLGVTPTTALKERIQGQKSMFSPQISPGLGKKKAGCPHSVLEEPAQLP
jgi:hypothetical protein